MMNYNKINNATGWLVFTISLITYLLTMAPTAPFWDCGEFLACMNELEVPHPPGAPFFLILGRVFLMFAGSNESIAWWGNFMSVVCSALSVLFIFWTITILAKKIVSPTDPNPKKNTTMAIMFAGVVGALACNFSDSFWFNGVESEVYAMSSTFTAVVVWLMFKWDVHADEPHSLRYLVLIAFLMGLSTGAHLLNLLTIPALGMIFFFRKYTFTWPKFLAAFAISIVALGIVQFGIMQLTIEWGWKFEQYFTGTENAENPNMISGLGMPKGTGLMLWAAIIFGGIAFGIWYSQKKKMPYVNTIMLSVMMIYIGYGTYALIPIRSAAEPPINENEPASTVNFLKYLRREQYGDRPLVLGPRYNGNPERNPDGSAVLLKTDENYVDLVEGVPYSRDTVVKLKDGKSLTIAKGKVKDFTKPAGFEDIDWFAEAEDGSKVRVNTRNSKAYRISTRYVYDGFKLDYSFASDQNVFFPRMHSMQGEHYKTPVWGYSNFVSMKGEREDNPYDDVVTSGEDMRFFMQYQISHMYLRYFMWNFVGKAGDEQDMGWESGWAFWNSSKMPEHIQNSPGRNHYFFFPLLLGLFGMVFHFSVKKFDASSILALFIFTGFAIIIYLNQTPLQPRERDYSYAGSFQTFCIWIGLGSLGLFEALRKTLKKNTAIIVGSTCLVLVPGIMAWQGWDDHSRHLNYVAPDSAKNLLESCQKNAILFTNGDNDTFPLWYAQEVEGIRTDVRIINLSLLNTDWYIRQLKKKMNASPAVPVSLDQFYYSGDKNQQVDIKPGTKVSLPVDKARVLKNGAVRPEYASLIKQDQDKMEFTPRTRGPKGQEFLLKQDIMIIDILRAVAEDGWERPVYFASTIPSSAFIGLDGQGYFQAEGLAYRVVPVSLKTNEEFFVGKLYKERSYDLIMNKFAYRELNNHNIYVDDHVRNTILGNLRTNIFRTGQAFIDEADYYEAKNDTLGMMIAQDSARNPGANAARIDSMRKTIAANQETIEKDRKMAHNMFDVISTKAPLDVIPSDPSLIFMMGGGYADLGDKVNAHKYLDMFNKMGRETLSYLGYDPTSQDLNRLMQVFRSMPQVYMQMEEWEKAAQASDFVYSNTGEPRFQEMSKYFRSKIGGEKGPAVPGTTPAPGTVPPGGR